MRPAAMILAALVLGGAPAAAHAQVLRGRVTDYAYRAALAGVQIDLIDTEDHQAAHTTTDTAGFFELRAPRSGTYRVRASLIGYHPLTSEPLELGSRDVVEMTLPLSVEPVPLTPVVVRVQPGSRLAEFERRRTTDAAGHFITREDIERRPVATASELLIGVPGVTLAPLRGTDGIPQDRYTIVLPRGIGSCRAHVFIDGMEVPPSQGLAVDDLVITEWLGGVEIYRSAALAPSEYRRADGCGAVLFWRRDVEGGTDWRWIRIAAAAGFLALAALVTR